jgi:hypothetical protein
LQTIVLVGVTVALIMVIIGSDIARAFALVGAMSIVRFRTPLKDSRDLVFVFAAIAVGMACGVQFHVFAAQPSCSPSSWDFTTGGSANWRATATW